MKFYTPLLIFTFLINLVTPLNMGRKIFLRETTSMIGSNFLNSVDPTNNDKPKSKSISESTNDNPLTITFYSEINAQSCVALSQAIKTMDKQSKQLEIDYNHRMPIKLHIQSFGGELLPSFYVCDLIKSIETPVYIYIDGYVASAASLIAVCGNKRFMTPHSSILIHQLKSSSSGKFNEMKDEFKNLNFFMDSLKEIYLENTRIKNEELDELLKTDIWLPSSKCLELGLIDEIIF
tara:strand:- start:12328 stop:13032 length:705 start_codon:yes stop_codon:yes gene_type:complete